jgi:hypothetical protein
MKRLYLTSLLLWSLLLVQQAAKADGVTHLALDETFNANKGTGGRDDAFSGQIASSNIAYDLEGWTGNTKDNSVYGGKQCLRFGSSSKAGTCTTPAIVLIGTAKTATLTFMAAGWASGTNTLTVTANEGVALTGDTQITLTKSSWKTYTVSIAATAASTIQLTFTGKRGFLDDVQVVEDVTAINAPSLTDEHLFWPNTTETATEHITLIPSDSTTVYYTTDGTTPSASNGKVAMLTSNISITGNTTVKAVAYYKTLASSTVSRTYTVGNTVSSIADFKALPDGTEARLAISADADARVLHAQDGKLMFLRDNSGTICLDFGTTATFNPAPVHNQHVAGWIVGRKSTDYGLAKLVATGNTTTDYLAMAAPVTEPDTEPTVITRDGENPTDLSSHMGDWVTMSDARAGTDVLIENSFGTDRVAGSFEFQQLVDVSGILFRSVGDGVKLAPVSYNNIKPVVYVVDENQGFVSPASDVEHATVRLKRTLSKDYWNTFAVPFQITDLDGEIREYTELNGNAMHFGKAASIQPGKPYLVKPATDIVNPVFSDVTLSSTEASFNNHGGNYYFTATYSPVFLASNGSQMFLTKTGKLAYPQDEASRGMKGMRAYFEHLGSSAPSLIIEGETTGIVTIDNMEFSNLQNATEGVKVYNLNGQLVSKPTKGVYIVNGKKVIIH